MLSLKTILYWSSWTKHVVPHVKEVRTSEARLYVARDSRQAPHLSSRVYINQLTHVAFRHFKAFIETDTRLETIIMLCFFKD